MNEQEALELYNQLVAMLRENQLGWIVDQVEGDIHQGILTQKEAFAFKESSKEDRSRNRSSFWPSDEQFSLAPTRLTSFPARVPYSNIERVQLLISAVIIAVLHTTTMERQVADFFIQADQAILEETPVLFMYPEEEVEVSTALSLSPSQEKLPNAESLLDLLRQLEREIRQ